MSERLPDEAGHAFTARAFLVGSALSLFLALACPYTVFLHHTAGMAADFITAGAVFLFFILTGGVNTLLRLLHPRLALAGPELIAVYTMMIVASAVPTWGLMANLLPILPGAFYYATPENDWVGIIHPYIPEWIAPRDELAIKYFYEGLPSGLAVPWDSWAVPLLAWAILIVAVYAGMISSMVIIRRQWVEHERLVYPLTQLPLEMIRRRDPTAAAADFFRNPLVWLAFAIPFVVYSTHGLHQYFNFVTPITVQNQFYLLRNTTALRLFLSFPVIGFTYFISLDVAFSLWFFHLLARLQTALFGLVGYQIPGHGETFTGGGIGSSPAVSHQAMGAMAVLVVVGLWAARRHLGDVVGKAFGRRPDVRDDDEAMSYRAAVWTFIGSALVVGLWLYASGMPAWVVPLFGGAAFITFFGLARIIAEAGVGFCRAQMVAPVFTVYGVGSEALGHGGLVSLAYTYAWAVDIRTSVMASTANGLKLAHAMGVRRPRRLLAAVALAAAISVAASAWITLRLAYDHGGINLQSWFFGGMPRTVFDFVADKINNPLDAHVIGPRWVFTGLGAAAMGLLMFLRQRVLAWPLHYLGLPIADTWVMSWVWFSILLGWLLKLVILRYGGVPLYRALRPFFLGLILGQISCAGLWMIVDVATGMVGNYIQIGVP